MRIALAADHGGFDMKELLIARLRKARHEVYFPVSPPLFSDADRAFLVMQKQTGAALHKNISFQPLQNRLKGVDQDPVL